jgi:hypothetical protein
MSNRHARAPIFVGHDHVMVDKPKAAVPAMAKAGPTPPAAALAPPRAPRRR